ncbi:MAG TPA: PKD domain-containing protein [Planctomycetota bacterium]
MRALPWLLALGPASVPAAQELVVLPSADAAVREDQQDTNLATGELLVQRDDYSAGSRWKRSYLRFDVAGLAAPPPALTLELTEGDGSSADTHFEVRAADASWSETSLTWKTAPPISGRRLGVYTGPKPGEGSRVRVPLDPSWIQRDGSYALVLVELRSGGTSQLAFHSREDGEDAPRLLLGTQDLPPLAGFTSRDHEGPVPFAPELVNCAPLDATAYLWDFGDGTSSTERSPRKTYATPGRYTVTLAVTRAGGTATCARPGMFLAHPADHETGSAIGWSKLSNTRGGRTPGLRAEDMFGRSVDGIGDVDGDGIGDLAVGAIGEDKGAYNAGAVWILFLDVDRTIRAHVKIAEGLAGFGADLDAEDGFGRKVAGIGDWDLDGVPDLAVGANRDDDGGTNRGAVYLLFLDRDGSVKSSVKLAQGTLPFGLDNGDEFGRGVTRLEDMDGDGVPELAVGAIGDDDGSSNNGAVWILYMRRDGSVKAHAKLSATSGRLQSPFVRSRGGTWFGMDVDALGDLDGNGVTDLAVGALLDDSVVHGSGALYVIRLNPDGSSAGDHLVNGSVGGLAPGELEANDEFGGAVAGLGDVDGDGIPDVACAAIRDDDNGVRDTELFGDWGAVYVLFLRADGSLRDYQKLSATRGGLDAPLRKYDRIGEGLGALGDVNGDGVPDLAIGSRFDDDGGSNKGAVYLVHLNDGRRNPPTADFLVTPAAGPAPLRVDLMDRSTGDVTGWRWDLGDGALASEPVTSHLYELPGTYTVALTVSGPSGSASKSATVSVLDPEAIVPLGCGVNPLESFQVLSGAPRLGATMVVALDNPYGTQAPGSLPTVLTSWSPHPLTPCGVLRAGLGMAGGGASGELLLDPTAPLARSYSGPPWLGPGQPVGVTLKLPANAAFLGRFLYLQGRLVDGSPGAVLRVGLANGVRLRLGP